MFAFLNFKMQSIDYKQTKQRLEQQNTNTYIDLSVSMYSVRSMIEFYIGKTLTLTLDMITTRDG
jgi:hypothetical protein